VRNADHIDRVLSERSNDSNDPNDPNDSNDSNDPNALRVERLPAAFDLPHQCLEFGVTAARFEERIGLGHERGCGQAL
jgi:hypothetical protein